MLSWLWDFIKNPDNRTIVAWLCGGLAVAAGGTWKVIVFIADRKKDGEKKSGDSHVIQLGQGLALGDKATFYAPVTVAPSSGPSPEHIAQIQKPLADELAAQRAQIENLTKMLLEKNPAAAPGAQQAVGGAVQSIAQGAAEGDTRLQQALELLQANKTSEAEPLLKAFAEE